jgi:hypothetical protein
MNDIIPEIGQWVKLRDYYEGPGKIININFQDGRIDLLVLGEIDVFGTSISEEERNLIDIEEIITDPSEICELEYELTAKEGVMPDQIIKLAAVGPVGWVFFRSISDFQLNNHCRGCDRLTDTEVVTQKPHLNGNIAMPCCRVQACYNKVIEKIETMIGK